MKKKCTDVIADWLADCNVIEEEDKELYSYAVNSFVFSLCPLFLAIIFGICFECIPQCITLIVPFMVIRKFSGGYHTKHLWTCLPCSCLLLFLSMILSIHIKCGWELLLVTAGAVVSLIGASPIDHENKKLNFNEKKQYKKDVAVLTTVFFILAAILYASGMKKFTVCISIGIILTASLQMPCLVMKVKKGC